MPCLPTNPCCSTLPRLEGEHIVADGDSVNNQDDCLLSFHNEDETRVVVAREVAAGKHDDIIAFSQGNSYLN